MSRNKRQLGNQVELAVKSFLQGHGVRIVEHSFRCRFGEIDLIGYDEDTLVFFEVKYRSTEEYGYAEEAVDLRKQKKISKVSDVYRLYHHIPMNQAVRFDVVAVQNHTATWIKNAFEYCG